MTPAPPGPLEGVRVLDLTRVVAGPSCSRTLVELGADVIKLEPPEGDLTRKARPTVDGVSLYFAQQNCGKRCISVDLSTQAGREIAFELARRSDVVLENFRPGVVDRLGLGYDAVRAVNPGVVHVSISGYGPGHSASMRRAYAPVIHAEMGHTDFAATRLGREPEPEVTSHGDMYSGMQATAGLLAALYVRERTGEGQRVDVSMAETMLAINEWTATDLAAEDGGEHSVFGGFHAPILRLGDDSRAVISGDPCGAFRLLCAAMGRPELMADPRFAEFHTRYEHRADVLAVLAEWAAALPDFDALDAALYPQGLVAGRVRTMADAVAEDWTTERGVFVEIPRGEGTARLPRGPIRMSARHVGMRGAAAHQGEHNRAVLREVLGYDDARIDDLEASGVLVSRRG